jgi:hypothetical protein
MYDGDIIHAATDATAHMVVGLQLGIEASLTSTRLQLAHLARAGQQVEIPVDGPQADAGQLPTHHRKKFIGGGVAPHIQQRVQNDTALAGHALQRGIHLYS